MRENKNEKWEWGVWEVGGGGIEEVEEEREERWWCEASQMLKDVAIDSWHITKLQTSIWDESF